MNFKNWFLINENLDSNGRELQKMLIRNGFSRVQTERQVKGGSHEKWIKHGQVATVYFKDIRNPKTMFKKIYRDWRNDLMRFFGKTPEEFEK